MTRQLWACRILLAMATMLAIGLIAAGTAGRHWPLVAVGALLVYPLTLTAIHVERTLADNSDPLDNADVDTDIHGELRKAAQNMHAMRKLNDMLAGIVDGHTQADAATANTYIEAIHDLGADTENRIATARWWAATLSPEQTGAVEQCGKRFSEISR